MHEQQIVRALALAEAARRELSGPGRRAALDRLEGEYGRLRRALDALIVGGDGERAERLVRALRDHWWDRGRLDEGREVIARALAIPRLPAAGATRAALLDHAGALAVAAGDPVGARRHFEAALAIRRASGTAAELAASLHHLASVIRWKQGDAETALGLYEEALAHARGAGDRVLTAAALMPLGTLALERGDLGAARACLTEGLALFLEARLDTALPTALEQFAALAAAEGRPHRSLRLAGAGAAQHEQLGTIQWPEMRAWVGRHLAPARRALSDAAADAAWAAGRAMGREQAVAYALGEPTAEGGESSRRRTKG